MTVGRIYLIEGIFLSSVICFLCIFLHLVSLRLGLFREIFFRERIFCDVFSDFFLSGSNEKDGKDFPSYDISEWSLNFAFCCPENYGKRRRK